MYYFMVMIFSGIVAFMFLLLTNKAVNDKETKMAVGSTVMTIYAGSICVWSLVEWSKVIMNWLNSPI